MSYLCLDFDTIINPLTLREYFNWQWLELLPISIKNRKI